MPRTCPQTSLPTSSTTFGTARLPQLITIAQGNGAASAGSDLQEMVVSESGLWFSDAAKATVSGVSELFWVSLEVGNEGGDKNQISNLSLHFVTSP